MACCSCPVIAEGNTIANNDVQHYFLTMFQQAEI